MNTIFKDHALQERFEKDGYAKITLLKDADIKSLFDYYHDQQLDNKIDGGFHISLDNQNEDLVKTISHNLENSLMPYADNIFKDYKIFTSSFVIKEPGKKNIVPPHQDWSFVDESINYSATCWIPLVDVTEENGALGVIKGSHKVFSHPRSSPSPQSKSPLADHIFTLFPYVDIIEMKAGECLIFDNRLIHASPPNLTQNARIAVGIGITGKDVQLKHYYQIPETEPAQLQVFDIDRNFFTFYNNKRLSDLFDNGKTPEDISEAANLVRDTPTFTKDEMNDIISKLDDVTYNTPLMEKLAALFNYSLDGNSNTTTMEQTNQEETINDAPETHSDERSFFKKYTPVNIVKEILWRAKGRP